jgi:hypothetical protein
MTMALAAEVIEGVETVVYPDESQSSVNFKHIIQIRWPDIDERPFILCVGTAEGNWDLFVGEVGQDQQTFDFSELQVDKIFVQLISGDSGEVGPVIRINRQ